MAIMGIRAIEINASRMGAAFILPDILDQIAEGLHIRMVTADGAQDTRACHTVVGASGAAAVFPPRKKAKSNIRREAATRNAAIGSSHNIGLEIWERWSGYHRRSSVEANMRCFKLMDHRVLPHDFDRQAAERQIRATFVTRFTAHGTPRTQRAGSVCHRVGTHRPSGNLRNKAKKKLNDTLRQQLLKYL